MRSSVKVKGVGGTSKGRDVAALEPRLETASPLRRRDRNPSGESEARRLRSNSRPRGLSRELFPALLLGDGFEDGVGSLLDAVEGLGKHFLGALMELDVVAGGGAGVESD